jgi:hypothetical protein
METTQRHACLLRAFEPSLRREVQLGKIVPVKTRTEIEWMYVNNVSARLEIADSFGIAVPVVKLMERWSVGVVLYIWGQKHYWTGIHTILRLHPWTPGRKPLYYQIPQKEWHESTSIRFIPRTNDVLTLAWDERDATYAQAQAQQLGLAL